MGNIASGSSQFGQTSNIVEAGDLAGFRKRLASLGISKADTAELEQAIKNDGPNGSECKLGKQVSSWLGKMVGKSAQGLLKVSLDVAATTLSTIIKSYCGFPS